MIDRGIQEPAQTRAPKHGRRVLHQAWTEHIPDNEWATYETALRALSAIDCPFMLGGAFGLAAYTGRWRNTKDLDFYVLPAQREAVIDALTRAGFVDYYDTLPYVRHWIYRSHKDGCIVDIIWAMANQRAQVDEQWLERAPEILVHGHRLKVIPAEELAWCKLYVMQKDRCDWPDVVNLIHATNTTLDWEYLMRRLGEDLPLLVGLLNVQSWLCPGDTLELPEELRASLSQSFHRNGAAENKCHIDWLDTRPWFVPKQEIS